MDQRVPRWSVGGLELHGQRPEAAFGGAFKSLAVLQQRPVQMETDVCLETLRKTLQHLETGSEGTDGRMDWTDGQRRERKEGRRRVIKRKSRVNEREKETREGEEKVCEPIEEDSDTCQMNVTHQRDNKPGTSTRQNLISVQAGNSFLFKDTNSDFFLELVSDVCEDPQECN